MPKVTEIFKKIIAGNLEVVKEFTTENINSPDPVLRLIPLQVALLQDNFQMVQALLGVGANFLLLAEKFVRWSISSPIEELIKSNCQTLIEKYQTDRTSLNDLQAVWLYLQIGGENSVAQAIKLFEETKEEIVKGKIALFIGYYYFFSWKEKNEILEQLMLKYLLDSYNYLKKTDDKTNFAMVTFLLGEISLLRANVKKGNEGGNVEKELKKANEFLKSAVENCETVGSWAIEHFCYKAAQGQFKANDNKSAQAYLIKAAAAAKDTPEEEKLFFQKIHEVKRYHLLADIFAQRTLTDKNKAAQHFVNAVVNYQAGLEMLLAMKPASLTFKNFIAMEIGTHVVSFVRKYNWLDQMDSLLFEEKKRLESLLQLIYPQFLKPFQISFGKNIFTENIFEFTIEGLYQRKIALYEKLFRGENVKQDLIEYFLFFNTCVVNYCLPKHQAQLQEFYRLYFNFFVHVNKTWDSKNLSEIFDQKITISPKLFNGMEEAACYQVIMEHMFHVAIATADKPIVANIILEDPLRCSIYYRHQLFSECGSSYDAEFALETYLQATFGSLVLTGISDWRARFCKEDQLSFVYKNYRAALKTISKEPKWLGNIKKEIQSLIRDDSAYEPFYHWHKIFLHEIFSLVLPAESTPEEYVQKEKCVILFRAISEKILSKENFSYLLKPISFPLLETIPQNQLPHNILSAVVLQTYWLAIKLKEQNEKQWSVAEFEKLYKKLKKYCHEEIIKFSGNNTYKTMLENIGIKFESCIQQERLKIKFAEEKHAKLFKQAFLAMKKRFQEKSAATESQEKRASIAETAENNKEVIIENYMFLSADLASRLASMLQKLVAQSYTYDYAEIKPEIKSVPNSQEKSAAKTAEISDIPTPKVLPNVTHWSHFEYESEETESEDVIPDLSNENEKKLTPAEDFKENILPQQHQQQPPQFDVRVNNPNVFFPKLQKAWTQPWTLSALDVKNLYENNEELLLSINNDCQTLASSAKALKVNYRSVLMYLMKIAVKLTEVNFGVIQPPFAKGQQIDLWRNILCYCVLLYKKEEDCKAALEITDYLHNYVQQVIKNEKGIEFSLIDLNKHPQFGQIDLTKSKELTQNPAACLQNIKEEIAQIKNFKSVDGIAGSLVIIGEMMRIVRKHQRQFCITNFGSDFMKKDFIKNQTTLFKFYTKHPKTLLLDQVQKVGIEKLLRSAKEDAARNVLLFLLFIEFRNTACHPQDFIINDYKWLPKLKDNIKAFELKITDIISKIEAQTTTEENKTSSVQKKG